MLTILRAGVSTDEIARSLEKPRIANRPGLTDTNGEIFAESDQGEKIRFYASRTNAREKGWTLSSIFPSRSTPNVMFSSRFGSKMRSDGRVVFSRGPKLGIFDFEDHVSPQRKYTFNRENTHEPSRRKIPLWSVISRFLSLSSSLSARWPRHRHRQQGYMDHAGLPHDAVVSLYTIYNGV